MHNLFLPLLHCREMLIYVQDVRLYCLAEGENLYTKFQNNISFLLSYYYRKLLALNLIEFSLSFFAMVYYMANNSVDNYMYYGW